MRVGEFLFGNEDARQITVELGVFHGLSLPQETAVPRTGQRRCHRQVSRLTAVPALRVTVAPGS